MRTATLICACGLALISSQALTPPPALAQTSPPLMGDAPSESASTVEMKPSPHPVVAVEKDPAERSAKSTECAQKADAQGLQGKARKHFLHKCKSGA